jgi:hypothetical protein
MVSQVPTSEKGGTCSWQTVGPRTLELGPHEGPNGLELEGTVTELLPASCEEERGLLDKKAELLPDDGITSKNIWPRIFRPAGHHSRMDVSNIQMTDKDKKDGIRLTLRSALAECTLANRLSQPQSVQIAISFPNSHLKLRCDALEKLSLSN